MQDRTVRRSPAQATEVRPRRARWEQPGLPVDWWDAAARTWRPTLLVPREGAPRPAILVPSGAVTSTMPVARGSLRPSLLLTDALARHWVARERVMLLLGLVEQSDEDEGEALRQVLQVERAALASLRATWATAFRGGGSGVHPPAGVVELQGMLLLPPMPAALLGRATQLIGAELLRLYRALRRAGTPPERALEHPMVACLASWLQQAAGRRARDALMPAPPGWPRRERRRG